MTGHTLTHWQKCGDRLLMMRRGERYPDHSPVAEVNSLSMKPMWWVYEGSYLAVAHGPGSSIDDAKERAEAVHALRQAFAPLEER